MLVTTIHIILYPLSFLLRCIGMFHCYVKYNYRVGYIVAERKYTEE